MTEIILHHYPESTFSERVRLAMGLKGLCWRSVIIPAAMPKPDLLPLTGGYRRTPVLQIGADVYCDTLLILRRLETLHPAPSLYPGGTEGAAKAIAWWADKSLFPPALGVLAALIGDRLPPDFVAERRAFGFPLDAGEAATLLYRHVQQGGAHLHWLAQMLRDGRPYLLGQSPSAADLAAYCPIWMLKTRVGERAEALLPLAALGSWYDRITAIGHGTHQDLSSTEALQLAAVKEPDEVAARPSSDPSGIIPGQEVIVMADDTGRDKIRGILLATGPEELVVGIRHTALGNMNLHFPRAGFDVTRA